MNRLRHNIRRHKYNAKPKVVDGIRFPSQKEADYYVKLKWLQKQGEVITFIRQPMFDLGGGTTYKGDFLIFWADGTVSFVDVKGVRTKAFIKAKKQVEGVYPITIEEA